MDIARSSASRSPKPIARVRRRRDPLSFRRVDPWRARVHRANTRHAGQRRRDGTAHHDRRRKRASAKSITRSSPTTATPDKTVNRRARAHHCKLIADMLRRPGQPRALGRLPFRQIQDSSTSRSTIWSRAGVRGVPEGQRRKPARPGRRRPDAGRVKSPSATPSTGL